MIVTNPKPFSVPETPAIDVNEARWAAMELSDIITKLGPDSPVGLVLRQARREVGSLIQSTGATVVGPIRVAA